MLRDDSDRVRCVEARNGSSAASFDTLINFQNFVFGFKWVLQPIKKEINIGTKVSKFLQMYYLANVGPCRR